MNDRIVCVIDDDAAVLKSLSRLLKAWGFCVQAFSSAQQFLRQLSDDDSHIGCLVIDVYMPGMSGVELRGILERSQRRFPIIFPQASAATHSSGEPLPTVPSAYWKSRSTTSSCGARLKAPSCSRRADR
jgi:FixJ family two-component response regulator